MDYNTLTIKELHDLYVKGEVKPLEVVEQAIAKAKKDTSNALEATMYEAAIEMAKKLGKEPVEVDNLLWGIPYFIKDNFSTKGVETTASSDILKGYVPLYDAEVITRLNRSKAIPIGKTTLDELAMGGSGMSGHLGRTFNPYDPSHRHMIGGSSAGSASVVASGIVPFALGSDTGDSVRKPASYAGLVGLKPTWGRISRHGLFPFTPSFDAVGYFTRSVYDSAVLLSVLAGHDEKDFTSSTKEVEHYHDYIPSVKGVKIALIKGISDTIANSSLRRSYEKSLEELKKRGAIVEYVEIKQELLNALFSTYFVISCSESTSNNANLDGIKFGARKNGSTYTDVIKNTRTAGFSALIKRRFILGSYSLKQENQELLFRRAQKARRLIVDAINQVLVDYDFIYLPAAPDVAPLFDKKSDNLNIAHLVEDNHLVIANLAGLPSLTIPACLDKGLPIGVNLTGRPFSEKSLFAVAHVIEEINGLRNITVGGF
jgi:aspartyl-tRNA(Asn)/glutamyl-tRNA(Gln) amidotransferase subunit A